MTSRADEIVTDKNGSRYQASTPSDVRYRQIVIAMGKGANDPVGRRRPSHGQHLRNFPCKSAGAHNHEGCGPLLYRTAAYSKRTFLL